MAQTHCLGPPLWSRSGTFFSSAQNQLIQEGHICRLDPHCIIMSVASTRAQTIEKMSPPPKPKLTSERREICRGASSNYDFTMLNYDLLSSNYDPIKFNIICFKSNSLDPSKQFHVQLLTERPTVKVISFAKYFSCPNLRIFH